MMKRERNREAFEWQIGVWNRMSDIYVREIDRRLFPIVEAVIRRAELAHGENVLDLGTGTGAVAAHAAPIVGARGQVVGVDMSPEMLYLVRERMAVHTAAAAVGYESASQFGREFKRFFGNTPAEEADNLCAQLAAAEGGTLDQWVPAGAQ